MAAASRKAAAQAVQMPTERKHLHQIMSGAKQRCRNPRSKAYKDYGGRGIEFRFASVASAAEYVAQHIGPRPSLGHSIDRIDNDRHYEPGNLRWATRSEQARNKRKYKGSRYGYRLKYLQDARPDYTYEALRRFVNMGWSNERIIEHRKGAHVRHNQLRATE